MNQDVACMPISDPQNMSDHATYRRGASVSHLGGVPSHHVVTESLHKEKSEARREMSTDNVVCFAFLGCWGVPEVIPAEYDVPLVWIVPDMEAPILASITTHHQVTKGGRVLYPFQYAAGWAQRHHVVRCHAECVAKRCRAGLLVGDCCSSCHQPVHELKHLRHNSILPDLVLAFDELSEAVSFCAQADNYFGTVKTCLGNAKFGSEAANALSTNRIINPVAVKA